MTTNWPNKHPPPMLYWVKDGIRRGHGDKRIAKLLGIESNYVEYYRGLCECDASSIRQSQRVNGTCSA